ncbi:group-specific protein [Peribacillus frigoritolerans]|uniref:group-specific protein n=1 Tax=Peribacillus frigoritolerans TaxID=450367 RepID=UPI001059A178|nr:group-specific protein [Peribacillus frigoritolerans]TDL82422.1 group-specific protein [Peribacillus frigoritolerans]
MENTLSGFEMEVNAPYSLNYLIYVQNIYINSENQDRENPLFPYVESATWGLVEGEFENIFTEVWNEAVKKNYHSGLYDHNGTLELDKTLYQKLFKDNETGEFGYSESVKSFVTWWNGIYGRISIESVFDENRMNKVYTELSRSLNVNKRLKINLIYDNPLLTENTYSTWYAVLPIEDIFNSRKRSEVISKLFKCCEIV